MTGTPKNITLGSVTPELVERYVAAGKPFKAGSMRGAMERVGGEGTHLNEEWRARLGDDYPKISYTIYSYYTPIAWRIPDGWVIVSQHFSLTSTQHQHTIARLSPCVHGGFGPTSR